MSNYRVRVYLEKKPGFATDIPDYEIFEFSSFFDYRSQFDKLSELLLHHIPSDCGLRYDLTHGVTDPELRPELADSERCAAWLFEGDECDNLEDCSVTGCHYETYLVLVDIDDYD